MIKSKNLTPKLGNGTGTRFDRSFKMISNLIRPSALDQSMVSLDNLLGLSVLYNRIGWRIISACTDRPVKLVKRLKVLFSFLTYILQMKKHHGATYVVGYLKASQLAVQKAIARDKIKSMWELNPVLGARKITSSGLPRFIPLQDRRAILAGNVFIIRFWLTLYSIYRVIKIPGEAKLSTITDPFSGDSEFIERGYKEVQDIVLKNLNRFPIAQLSKEYGLLLLEKSSPTCKTSWTGWLRDLPLLAKHGMVPHLRLLLSAFGQNTLSSMFEFFLYFSRVYKFVPTMEQGFFWNPLKSNRGNIGQLSEKDEAAGKVRVFAMVDVWTQSVLKPLHEMLFSFLRSLPNDATFDQHASVKRCMAKSLAAKKSYGYDLSAATDRLPISLQVAILSSIIGESAAQAWKALLVDRTYVLVRPMEKPISMKYAVGQPMGALSSWAMLAVTHHLIVQQAYIRTLAGRPGDSWFSNYELLGDDIVIFDTAVAHEYLFLMDKYGVPINTSKSVIASNATFEFAKVTGHLGQNVTAISWKMFISQQTFVGRASIFFSLCKKDMYRKPISVLRALTAKTRFVAGDYSLALATVLTMMVNTSSITFSDVLQLLRNPKKPMKKSYYKWLLDVSPKRLEIALSALLTTPEGSLPSIMKDEAFWDKDSFWVKMGLRVPLEKFSKEWGQKDRIHELAADVLQEILLPPELAPKNPVTEDQDLDAWLQEPYYKGKLSDDTRPSLRPENLKSKPSFDPSHLTLNKKVTEDPSQTTGDYDFTTLYRWVYFVLLNQALKCGGSFYKGRQSSDAVRVHGFRVFNPNESSIMTDVIPRLLERTEEKNALMSLQSLVVRAKAKAGSVSQVPVKVDSPLSILKWLKKIKWGDERKERARVYGDPFARWSSFMEDNSIKAKMAAITEARTLPPTSWELAVEIYSSVRRGTSIVLKTVSGFSLGGIVILSQLEEGEVTLPLPPVSVPDLADIDGDSISPMYVGIGIGIAVLTIGLWLWFSPNTGIDPLTDKVSSLIVPEPNQILSGPVSPTTLLQVQTDLHILAWEANLDLSPIGALWDIPF